MSVGVPGRLWPADMQRNLKHLKQLTNKGNRGFTEKGSLVPSELGEKSSTSVRWIASTAVFILTPNVWAVGQRQKQDVFTWLVVQPKQPSLTQP